MRQMPSSENGYWIQENVISHRECDALIAALSDARRSRAGARHLMNNPAVAELAADRRLLAVAESALGEAVPYWATLFGKSGQTNWVVAWAHGTPLSL